MLTSTRPRARWSGAVLASILALLGSALLVGAQSAPASAAAAPGWNLLYPSGLQEVCAMVETPTAPPPMDRPIVLDVKTGECPEGPDRRFQWKLISMSDGTVQIKHDRSNGCLDGTVPAIWSRDSVAVTACHVATAGQRWLATEHGSIKNVATGQYLDAAGTAEMVPYLYNLALTSSYQPEWGLAAEWTEPVVPDDDSDGHVPGYCDPSTQWCPEY